MVLGASDIMEATAMTISFDKPECVNESSFNSSGFYC